MAEPTRGILARMSLRKTVEHIQHETSTSELKRTLGPWNLVFLGVGCIIGAGAGAGATSTGAGAGAGAT